MNQTQIIDAEIIEETPTALPAKATTTVDFGILGGLVLALGIVAFGALVTALCLALAAVAIVLAVPGVPAYLAYDAIQTRRRQKRAAKFRAQREAMYAGGAR